MTRADALDIERETNLQPLVDTALLPTRGPHHEVITAAHRVYEHLIALWAPGVIEAAHDLGVFAELARRPATVAELAAALSTDERATRVLMDSLYAYDVVERTTEAGRAPVYTLPAATRECLLPGGLFSLVGKITYDRKMAWHAWRNLADSVRNGSHDNGGPDRANQISAEEYESLAGGINFWAPPVVDVLRQGLEDLGWPTDRPVNMIDVGCGTGVYSQLLLQQFEQWRATGLDVERIVKIAQAQSERLGTQDRFSLVVRDFWKDAWGTDADLILLANIFHLQNPESALTLVRQASEALATGGLLCVIDHVVDEERNAKSSQDRFALLFAASMLATGGGDAYTLRDYDTWFEAHGLRRVQVLQTPMHRILLAKKL